MFLKLNVVEILTSQLMWSPVAEPVIVLTKTRYFIFINVFGNEQGTVLFKTPPFTGQCIVFQFRQKRRFLLVCR